MFTNYRSNETEKEFKALLWDGDYLLYRKLVDEEPRFVAVLHDGGNPSREVLKVWNESCQTWEDCLKGDYIVKTKDSTFTVTRRESLIREERLV